MWRSCLKPSVGCMIAPVPFTDWRLSLCCPGVPAPPSATQCLSSTVNMGVNSLTIRLKQVTTDCIYEFLCELRWGQLCCKTVLADVDLLSDLSHGFVSQSRIQTMTAQQAQLLAHALSCESRLVHFKGSESDEQPPGSAHKHSAGISASPSPFVWQSRRFRLWFTAPVRCTLRKTNSWWKECWTKSILTPKCCPSGKRLRTCAPSHALVTMEKPASKNFIWQS